MKPSVSRKHEEKKVRKKWQNQKRATIRHIASIEPPKTKNINMIFIETWDTFASANLAYAYQMHKKRYHWRNQVSLVLMFLQPTVRVLNLNESNEFVWSHESILSWNGHHQIQTKSKIWIKTTTAPLRRPQAWSWKRPWGSWPPENYGTSLFSWRLRLSTSPLRSIWCPLCSWSEPTPMETNRVTCVWATVTSQLIQLTGIPQKWWKKNRTKLKQNNSVSTADKFCYNLKNEGTNKKEREYSN